MPENDRLNGCLNEIEVGLVVREATPRFLMKLGIQLHLTGLSLSNNLTFIAPPPVTLDRNLLTGSVPY